MQYNTVNNSSSHIPYICVNKKQHKYCWMKFSAIFRKKFSSIRTTTTWIQMILSNNFFYIVVFKNPRIPFSTWSTWKLGINYIPVYVRWFKKIYEWKYLYSYLGHLRFAFSLKFLFFDRTVSTEGIDSICLRRVFLYNWFIQWYNSSLIVTSLARLVNVFWF